MPPEQERASRDRKWAVIFLTAGVVIVLLGPYFPDGTSDQSMAATPTIAYTFDLNNRVVPAVETTTYATPNLSERVTLFSPEVLLWAQKTQEWSQTHSQGRVPPDFILAIIQAESGGDPNALSPGGESRGLFQLSVGNLQPGALCENIDPFIPDEAAQCAVGVLMPRALTSATRGDMPHYPAAAVGYHLPAAIPWALGEETPEKFVERMNALGYNGANQLNSAALFRDRVAPLLAEAGLR